jgi:hypothetical protein
MMLMMKKKREGLLRDSQISIHGVESSLYHGVWECRVSQPDERRRCL